VRRTNLVSELEGLTKVMLDLGKGDIENGVKQDLGLLEMAKRAKRVHEKIEGLREVTAQLEEIVRGGGEREEGKDDEAKT
jgi:hypothetical protein